jgi:hypothetical protein
LNRYLGSWRIKVSRPFPLRRGSREEFIYSTSPSSSTTSTTMLIVLSCLSLKISFTP